jgi:hypothetical protein
MSGGTIRRVRFRMDGHPETPVDGHRRDCDGQWVMVRPVFDFNRWRCSCGYQCHDVGFVFVGEPEPE